MTTENDTHFYLIGLSYKNANIDIRSKFSLTQTNQEKLLIEAKKLNLDNVMVLSTCNRTELMGFAKNPKELISLLCKYTVGKSVEFKRHAHCYKNKDAVSHFIKITAGLDSQILGDYEIVSQVKNAFQLSKHKGTANTFLEKLYNVSLQASKEIKNVTSLSTEFTSVSHEVINYINENINNLEHKKILIYGLGNLGTKSLRLAVNNLNPTQISIVNRTDEKSVNLAKKLNVNPVYNANINDAFKKSDIIIIATGSSKPTLNLTHINNSKEQWIFDLSVPANVESKIKHLDNKHVINVDELSLKSKIASENKKNQIPLAIKIVENYRTEFFQWLKFRKKASVIKSLKNTLDIMQKDVVSFHLESNQNLEKEWLEEHTSQVMNKIIAKFAIHLKKEQNYIDEPIQTIEKVLI